MNPFPMVLADLRSMRWTALVVVVLIGVAVAVGVGISAQERGVRQASARAADDFPLLIGAPGSQTQLVLTSVYLQIDAIPLIPGAILNRLALDKRVADVAPIAFGDIVQGWKVIGTTANLATRWGRIAPAQGRMFAHENEAVVGADVNLAIGEDIIPSHGTTASDPAEEAAHKHAGVAYKIVGKLPRQGTPWDRVILIPVESVWETHGLGNGHAEDDGPLGPPFDAKNLPGVPAIVVKPRTIADAYSLRGDYRQNGTMALFPAEVLVGIYRATGNASDILVLVAGLNNIVVFLAVLLLAVTLVSLRRRRYALLRALGAPRLYIFLVIWLGAAGLISAGCLLGLGFGWLASLLAAEAIVRATGLQLASGPGWPELHFVLLLLGAGSLLATLPALGVWRTQVSAALR